MGKLCLRFITLQLVTIISQLILSSSLPLASPQFFSNTFSRPNADPIIRNSYRQTNDIVRTLTNLSPMFPEQHERQQGNRNKARVLFILPHREQPRPFNNEYFETRRHPEPPPRVYESQNLKFPDDFSNTIEAIKFKDTSFNDLDTSTWNFEATTETTTYPTTEYETTTDDLLRSGPLSDSVVASLLG